MIKENPLDKVRLDCTSNRRERRLREGELERIIAAANKTRNPVILPVILFALETGLRRSEILAATLGASGRCKPCVGHSKGQEWPFKVNPTDKDSSCTLAWLEGGGGDEQRNEEQDISNNSQCPQVVLGKVIEKGRN